MKTTTITKLIATLILSVSFAWSYSQEGKTCTFIEVSGEGYYDQLWLFTAEGTTEGFDNGWDGYKFINENSSAPQIYAVSPDGKFQISTSSNIHQQALGFIPGTYGTFTMTFTHTDIHLNYNKLYLHDKATGKSVDILAQGSTYTFAANEGDIRERFVMLTELSHDNKSDNKKDREIKDNKAKSVKVFSANKRLVIDNPNKEKAKVRLYNAQNGSFIMEHSIASGNNTEIDANTETGAYIVAISVENDIYNTTILLQ